MSVASVAYQILELNQLVNITKPKFLYLYGRNYGYLVDLLQGN